ncbi:unnamed protein product [Urochloa decumbens]|uniref:VWFA domain-containing protein n=1 Tax=Urochloa decumbens TaxID=240449 RepID=A0ABC9ANY5_9POAL
MSFADDEPPPANSSAGTNLVRDRVRLAAYINDKAPLEENTQEPQEVLLEVTDTSSAGERSGLDLVAVLDVSTSMDNDGKLDKLKTAMKFVISKLGPMDRLSIVSFASNARQWCGLRLMTIDAKEEIKDIIGKLSANGATNMRDGLMMGLQVLDGRRYKSGRVSSNVLMSDGEEYPKPEPLRSASDVSIGDVAVYTFGFGKNHDPKVLQAIASNSQGGTFLYVRDEDSLTKRFAEIMAGLLSVVVQDLELSVWPQRGHSTIKEVVAGSYLPKPTEDGHHGYSVRFGDLFCGEVRKVIVHLLLPAVHRGYRTTVIYAQCSYRTQGKTFYSPPDQPLRCSIQRTGSASQYATKKPEVEEELDRIQYVNMIEKASVMENEESARGKLEEAQKVLEAKQPNRMVVILMAELQQLLQLKRWNDLLARLLEHLTSHRRQRGLNVFAPPRTAKFVEQAEKFDKNPNEPPPSVEDDVKEEEAEVAATMPVSEQRREPRLLGRPWELRSSEWCVWAMVVLCTVLAIGVIIAGVAVFAVYIFFKPKMPYLVVSDARLVLLQYDQGGTIQSLQMSITIRAENNNSKADATFSSVDLALGFHGTDVVLLRSEPFTVPRESSLPLPYNVAVAPGPALDTAGMQAMDESLKAGVVPFDLFGKARTRWKVGVFVKIRYWTRISCRLRFFFPGNGTVMPTDRDRCRSK